MRPEVVAEATEDGPRPVRCVSVNPSGWQCDKTDGHDGYHRHEFAAGGGHHVWCDR